MLELNRNDYPMLHNSRPRKTSNQLSGAAVIMLLLVFITIVMMLVANMGGLILVDEPSTVNLPIPMPNR